MEEKLGDAGGLRDWDEHLLHKASAGELGAEGIAPESTCPASKVDADSVHR
jgi:hypothetical protein